jgi:hypothetical protein
MRVLHFSRKNATSTFFARIDLALDIKSVSQACRAGVIFLDRGDLRLIRTSLLYQI